MKKFAEIEIKIKILDPVACLQESSSAGFDGEWDFNSELLEG